MRMDRSEIADLRRIKLPDFISYLESTGWRRVKFTDLRTIVFAKDDSDDARPFLISLPAEERYTDYAIRLAEALYRLAEVEESTYDNVLQRIEAVGQDVIYLRLTQGRNDFPSVERTAHIVEGFRNLIVYGASMVREIRRNFERPLHEGLEQAKLFQVAHTIHGSFVFTIESQIVEQNPLWQGFEPVMLQRKVLERISRGFLSTHLAEQQKNADAISQNYEHGFNANMCKAVGEMLEDIRDGQVAFAVRWSAHQAPSADVAQFEPILLRSETAQYLDQAAKFLMRAADSDMKNEKTITGPVTSLSYEEQGERIVTIMVEGTGKVSVSLEAEDYTYAGHAHLAGQSVTVTGKLIREGRRGPYSLTSPRNFQVCQ